MARIQVRLVAAAVSVLIATTGCYPFGTNLGHFEIGSKCSPLNLRRLDTSATKDHADERAVLSHAIFITAEGWPIRPRVDGCAEPMDSAAYGVYLHGIMEGIRVATTKHDSVAQAGAARNAGKREAAKTDTSFRILLRIHGGLNTLNGTLTATNAMNTAIIADSGDTYPLFVNWESGLMSAYGEHLFLIRRGHRSSLKGWAVFDPFTSPVVLASDLATGLAHAPLTWGRQAISISGHSWWQNHQDECPPPTDGSAKAVTVDCGAVDESANEVAKAEGSLMAAQTVVQANKRPGVTPNARGAGHDHDGTIAVSRFEYNRSWVEAIKHIGVGLALAAIPTRYFVNPHARHTSLSASYYQTSNPISRAFRLIGWLPPRELGLTLLDGLGTPAWETMHRRPSLMYRPSDEFDRFGTQTAKFHRADGALAVFIDSLRKLSETTSPFHLSIVGHSMGAIVATEIIQREDSLPIDNIVFMASAASLREMEQSVIPYMQRHPTTEFYNLTLHPMADRREADLFRIAPYGSLLEWIDAHFGHVETELDRMSGKYDNLVRTALIFPDDVRGRTHIKAFGYNSGKGCGEHDYPYKHGDFNDPTVLYWREGFWHPGSAGCEEFRVNAQDFQRQLSRPR